MLVPATVLHHAGTDKCDAKLLCVMDCARRLWNAEPEQTRYAYSVKALPDDDNSPTAVLPIGPPG